MLTYLVILYLCAFVRGFCPNGCHENACCEVEPGKPLCCPYINGVCCIDGNHCCPQGSECDISGMSCRYPVESHWPMRALYAPVAKKETHEDVRPKKMTHTICPDRQSYCSENNTCCLMADKRWGCCKHAQGVCCSDGGHCCPANTMCNAKDGTCIPLQESEPSWPMNRNPPALSTHGNRAAGGKRPASWAEQANLAANSTKHVCEPVGSCSCPGDSTCCREKTGDWGCCPMIGAVCCSDGIHCCPKDSLCDVQKGVCIPHLSSPDQPEHKEPVRTAPTVNASEQVCADGKTRCIDQSTCCRLADLKSYGCCPLEEGVCCSDGEHCCPKRYRCNLKDGTCIGDSQSTGDTETSPLSGLFDIAGSRDKLGGEAAATTCPGGLVSCLSGTCCRTALGNYRCCPYKSGVCCPNSEHCCPEDSVCDASTGGCLLVDRSTGDEKPSDLGSRTITTTVITSRGSKDVVFCPGQDLYCPNATTCCPGEENSWSCCPYRNAVCCADRSHCCPSDTVCSPNHQGCLSSSSVTDEANVQPPTRVSDLEVAADSAETVSSITCPDDETVCDDHMPCCRLIHGQWGCCPLANGVCCTDANHCCPLGTRCTDNGYCASTGSGAQLYTAPYLIPGRRRSGGKQDKFLKGTNPVSFHYPLAQTAMPAVRDLMLISEPYRQMKEFHHVICSSGVHRCAEGQQCCPSHRYTFTCAPETSTCCSPSLDTVCPSNEVCSMSGKVCTRA